MSEKQIAELTKNLDRRIENNVKDLLDHVYERSSETGNPSNK